MRSERLFYLVQHVQISFHSDFSTFIIMIMVKSEQADFLIANFHLKFLVKLGNLNIHFKIDDEIHEI